jgi:alcohol dehydrogenase class IV
MSLEYDTSPIFAQFNFPTAYRIGAGRAAELAGACRELEIRRPLVVTDPGIAGLGWFREILRTLETENVDVEVFSAIDANPSTAHVEAGLAQLAEHRGDGCVLIGGGSAMDTGKCIALLANNPGRILDYEDIGDNWKQADDGRILPTIALPTTAGTGSEVGRAAVIVDPRDHSKKIIFHPQLQPDLVIADPLLTLGLPAKLTAATGMDALAHCFEAYCAPGYHPMADGIALEGMRLINENLLVAFEDGSRVDARTHLLMAASMGATAFQKGLGLIHALSHPLGGVTGLHHGTANAIFHPYVMVHNREVIEDRMPRIASVLDLEDESFDAVLEWTVALRAKLELPHTLEGILDEALIERLVPMAAADPSLATNPKPCSDEDLERVFRKALHGDLTP